MNREQMLKEARTIEAMKLGYMGMEGKFCCIAKRLGSSLLKQGGIYVDRTWLYDSYLDEDAIPTMESEEESFEVGIHFDGLSRGMNITITVYFHLREISVRYNGLIVYKEIGGELEGYAPDKEWEEKISQLFDMAKKLEREMKPFEKKKLMEATEKKKKEILETLRLKWGL